MEVEEKETAVGFMLALLRELGGDIMILFLLY